MRVFWVLKGVVQRRNSMGKEGEEIGKKKEEKEEKEGKRREVE